MENKLFLWSNVNAGVILTFFFLSLIFPVLMPGMAIVMFLSTLTLIFMSRDNWTDSGVFGYANAITFLKALISYFSLFFFAVGLIDNIIAAFCYFSLVFLDKLDGIAARRFGHSSVFGELFDSEVDAFNTLAMTLTLYMANASYFWFLVIGLLRYFYVLLIFIINPEVKKEKKSNINRILFVLMSFSFSGLLAFQNVPALACAVTCSVLIAWSFVKDFVWVVSQ